jgi:hypothetical protein
MTSPYAGLPINEWASKTLALIHQYPFSVNELYNIVILAWQDIFQSQIGSKPFRIGYDLFPPAQMMGYLLQELLALELVHRYAGVWRQGQRVTEKDLVYVADDTFSIEVKSSSSVGRIYGNRSYAQHSNKTKKSKTGYYLAINFQKFPVSSALPRITQVRFGWLDHEDWQGQTAATGQQARLSPDVERNKLLPLPLEQ